MVTETQFEEANRRASDVLAKNPVAILAKYDRGRIVVALNSGLEISFFPDGVQGLEGAEASQLEEIKISPSGLGIYFPKLDVDLYIPALLEGVFGSRKWTAARLGSAGGVSRSMAKLEAARINGRLGGRPKKKATVA